MLTTSTKMNFHLSFRNMAAILAMVAVLCFPYGLASRVTLVNNGYQNVLVAISAAAYQDELKDGLKSLLSATSAALMEATGNRTYFNSIQILPPNMKIQSPYKTPVHRNRRDTWEGVYPSFETADIRVDVANDAYGNYPYTQQSRGCGEPGDFIHLTPDFVLSPEQQYGAPEKFLANEWIKYRYGVFDENGYYDSDRYPQKYYGQDNQLTENVCSNIEVTWSENSCNEDTSNTGVPAHCTLTPDKNGNEDLNSSMMSIPVTYKATQYCNESTHNDEAPNMQNILCGGRSILEVMDSHPDFTNHQNQPNYNNYQTTQFTDAPAPETDISLVILWDPMDQTETGNSARPGIMKFLSKDFPNSSYFGMIETVNATTSNSPLVNLTMINKDNRPTIITAIKTMAFLDSGYTRRNFADVLSEAIQMVKGPSIQNTAVILMSNSISSSEISSSCITANTSNVQLHFITYNSNAAQSFLKATGCPGKSFLIQGRSVSTTTDLDNCYRDLQNRLLLDNILMNLPFTIAPDAFTSAVIFHENLYSNSSNGTFLIDVPIETVDVNFYIEGCSMYSEQVDMLIPSRWLRDPNHVVPYDDNTYAFFEAHTLDQNGTWVFGVTPQQGLGTIPYVVYAVGRSRQVTTDISLSVQAKAWTVVDNGKNMDGTTYPRVRLFTSVKRGNSPVFNAKVEAKIYDGSSSSSINITLYDDASGNPDVAAQDGIYSAYFTKSNTASRSYSIVINVTNNNGAATYPTTQYTWISQNSMRTSYTGNFQRTAQPDSFVLPAYTGPVPPGTISDFRVQSISGNQVIFQWTAPGSDLDNGKADKYIIGCSTTKSNFDNVLKLDNAPNSNIDTSFKTPTPKPSKTVQTFTIDGTMDQLTHYCAIQAVDLQNNYGAISAISSYYITASGMSTGAVAGIVIGVLLGLLLLIAIVVLVWWCCSKDDRQKTTSAEPSKKLEPIIPVIVPIGGASIGGSRHSVNEPNRPHSAQSKTHSHASGSRFDEDSSSDDEGSRYRGNAFNETRSQSPRAVATPQIPMDTFHNTQKPLGAGAPGNEYDSTFIMQQADVAIPQRLVKLAVIEDVGEYSDAKLHGEKPRSPNTENMQEYKNMPVYSHLLSKQPAPPPPPRVPSSMSSSSYSLNSVGKQTPAPHNTQV